MEPTKFCGSADSIIDQAMLLVVLDCSGRSPALPYPFETMKVYIGLRGLPTLIFPIGGKKYTT